MSPEKGEAERYAKELADNKGRMGLLSDQDFFSHYNRAEYILLHQNMMGFPSWWNHNMIVGHTIANIVQLSVDVAPEDMLKWWWTTKEFASYLFTRFGALHCSAAFDVVLDRAKDKFMKQFVQIFQSS